jgi:sugar phosphate isomerase/epimerase
MPSIKVGLDIGSLRMPVKQSIRVAAELGVDTIVLDATGEVSPGRLSQTGLRELSKLLEDCQLKVAALSFRTRYGYDTPIELESRIAATMSVMQFAQQLGGSVVVNHIGRVPTDPDSPSWSLMTDVLTEIGRHGQHVGVTLAAETGPDNAESWTKLFDALPDGSLALDLNPGNLLASGYSVTEFVQQLGHMVRHAHATDGVCDPLRRNGQLVALGHGAADFPAILSLLDGHGYQGSFTAQWTTGTDPIEATSAAVKFLRSS